MMNLNKQGRLFEMGMLPVFRSIPGHENWSRIYTRPSWQTVENNFYMSFTHRLSDRRDSITYFAFCFPYSYEESQIQLQKYDEQFSHCKYLRNDKCEPDDIYYHRELLCYSLDKRRIDLITISSCYNLNFSREPRFDPENLFPPIYDINSEKKINQNKRCYKFDKKRVFILTSRVHPGETPASFVFNGFLEFILRKDDPRSKALRQNFVFKLVPMLNPDGVYRGYYRTDQLGVNLNRFYLDPSFQTHPSIYAIKSLIVYHHINNRTSKEHDGLNFDDIFKIDFDDDNEEVIDDNEDLNNKNANQIMAITDEPTRTSFKGIRRTSINQPPIENFNPIQNNLFNDKSINTKYSNGKYNKSTLPSSLLANSTSNITNSSPSLIQLQNNNNNSINNQTENDTSNPSFLKQQSLVENTNLNKIDVLKSKPAKSLEFLSRINLGRNDGNKNALSMDDGVKLNNNNNNDSDEDDETTKINDSISFGYSNASTINKSATSNSLKTNNSPHLNDPKLNTINPLWSGIAFYVDLHGHAARRGCFIYGNSIDNEMLQIENVLFAKLISFNSQHFDFDGCNFSVKNMYMKDKREGLSKEGSGRVAMYKTLGILHSYTLECCYAGGRVMNTIAPAVNTSNSFSHSSKFLLASSGKISPPLHTDIPPKFLPEHYADVGKALAIAALDIFEMNPYTRVPNTSFTSLESVRNWIKFYIKSKNGGGINTATSTFLNNNNNNNSNSNTDVTIGSQSNNKQNVKTNLNNNNNKPSSLRNNSNSFQQQNKLSKNNSNSFGSNQQRQSIPNIQSMQKTTDITSNTKQSQNVKRNSIGNIPSNSKNNNSYKQKFPNNKFNSNSIADKNISKKSTPTPPPISQTPQQQAPQFTLFKTTDLFDQLNYSLKNRATNSKRNQQLIQQIASPTNVIETIRNTPTPTPNQQITSTSLIINKTNNSNSMVKYQRKSNFYLVSNINNNNTDPDQILLSKSQNEYYHNIENNTKTFSPTPLVKSSANGNNNFNSNSQNNIGKKLMPINKAGVFSSTGNISTPYSSTTNTNSTNNNNCINNYNKSTSNSPLSFINQNTNVAYFNDLNNIQQMNDSKLIRTKSLNNKNNSQFLLNNYNNLRSKTINFLLDFNLDNKNNSVALAAAAAAAAAAATNSSSAKSNSNQRRTTNLASLNKSNNAANNSSLAKTADISK